MSQPICFLDTEASVRSCPQCESTFRVSYRKSRKQFCGYSCSAKSRAHRPGARNANWRGGKSKHYLYATYMDMIGRCGRSTHHAYASYGGRGIFVCQRWRSDFWAFVADMGERPQGRSIDRIDNDGPYSPSNCRWATRGEQITNRRPGTWDFMQRLPQNQPQPACREGHPRTPEHVGVKPSGKRYCRTCHLIKQRARRTLKWESAA